MYHLALERKEGSVSGSPEERPRLLDLFCGAGGAAMGYHRAGFEVVGVDIKPQPHYPFEFYQVDAIKLLDRPGPWELMDPLRYPGIFAEEFDAIHASPPCQDFSVAKNGVARFRPSYEDLIEPTRSAMERTGLPWVIENVRRAPLRRDLVLCGTMFGLRVQRHRYFQMNWPVSVFPPAGCNHANLLDCYSSGANRKGTERQYADEMGVIWAPVGGRGTTALESIPPAYTEWIGKQLIAHLREPVLESSR